MLAAEIRREKKSSTRDGGKKSAIVERSSHSSIWREAIGNSNPLVGIDDGQTNGIIFIQFVCPSRSPIRGERARVVWL
jgi:hypothetical protein